MYREKTEKMLKFVSISSNERLCRNSLNKLKNPIFDYHKYPFISSLCASASNFPKMHLKGKMAKLLTGSDMKHTGSECSYQLTSYGMFIIS